MCNRSGNGSGNRSNVSAKRTIGVAPLSETTRRTEERAILPLSVVGLSGFPNDRTNDRTNGSFVISLSTCFERLANRPFGV